MRRTLWPHLALAAVLLAGCSGDPEPKEPDSTTSPSPTTTPPPLPEAATQETAEGAATFVDHYLDVLNYATVTGDTSPVEELSGTSCEACTQFARTVAQIYDDGGRITGGEWSTDDLVVAQHAGYWTAAGIVSTAAGTQQDSRNATARAAAETSVHIEFVLERTATDWVIYSFAGTEG